MVGDRMMVAPLFAGEPQRTVVLPEGKWHDFWTGDAVAGGTQVSVPASTEKIPVYVKSGSVIPWAEVAQHSDAPEGRRLTVRIYGDGSLPFTVRDGKTTLRLSWANGHGSVEGASTYEVAAWKQMG